jgi:RNA polymerase sigma-70 factor, ECF subfamily
MSDQIYGSTFAMHQPPDEQQFAELVECAQAGNREAIASFVQYYERLIRGYMRKLLGNDDIADDLYSEVVYKVCKALPKTDEGLRKQQAAKKWFFTIATNIVYDYFDKRLRMISLEYLEERYRAGDMKVAKDWHSVEQLSVQGAEETLCTAEDTASEQRLITAALEQIPGQLRRCFYMKDIQSLSHQEIAKTLSISESAARSYASRGRQAFIKAVTQLRAQHEGRMS